MSFILFFLKIKADLSLTVQRTKKEKKTLVLKYFFLACPIVKDFFPKLVHPSCLFVDKSSALSSLMFHECLKHRISIIVQTL